MVEGKRRTCSKAREKRRTKDRISMKRFLMTVITRRRAITSRTIATRAPWRRATTVAQGGGISKEERRGNVRRSKEAVARDPRDRQSQLAQVAGLCPLTQPTISNYVSPRERIYSRQGHLGREIPILLCSVLRGNIDQRVCIYIYIYTRFYKTFLSLPNIHRIL